MIPQFETDRLILRDVRLSDIPSYQKQFADWEIIQHLSLNVPWPYPADGVDYYVKNVLIPNQGKEQWYWVITLKSNPHEVIGGIILIRGELPFNRGFWLGKDFWGKGYMTEAVAPVTKYAFEKLGFEKLIFANAVGNNRSRRIKEKTGAKFLRIIPYQHVNPELKESELWELTKEAWSQT